MVTQTYGPFPVVDRVVFTDVAFQAGDTLRLRSSGRVNMGGGLLRGLLFGTGRFDANGKNQAAGPGFPAPDLRKYSLLFALGETPAHWLQGGVSTTFVVPPGAGGMLTLHLNDDHPADNSGGWRVLVFRETSADDASPAQPTTSDVARSGG
jgi:hypothetical protein